MEKQFQREEHYATEMTVCGVDFRVSHWEKPDGELVAYFGLKVGGSKAVSDMGIWPSAEELRNVAHMLAAAADDIEAHAAFIKAWDEAKAGEAA